MIQLGRCHACGGFLALASSPCPHCDEPAPPFARALRCITSAVVGGAVSMTLMACYGPAGWDETSCTDATCGDQAAYLLTADDLDALRDALPNGSYTGESEPGTCSVDVYATDAAMLVQVHDALGSASAWYETGVTRGHPATEAESGALVLLPDNATALRVERSAGRPSAVWVGLQRCGALSPAGETPDAGTPDAAPSDGGADEDAGDHADAGDDAGT